MDICVSKSVWEFDLTVEAGTGFCVEDRCEAMCTCFAQTDIDVHFIIASE